MNANIEVKEIQMLDLAFITQIGDKGLGNTFDKLIRWAAPKGLMNNPDVKLATIYYDSFKVTEADKVRMSACIVLEEAVEVSGEVGLTKIEAGKHIVGSFEIGVEEFEKSWSSLFIWMNEKGFKKAERNPFEIYHNDFNQHPEKKCRVDMYIPIE